MTDAIVKLIQDYHKLDVLDARSVFSNYNLNEGTELTRRGFELIMPVIQMHPITVDSKFRKNTVKNKILLAKLIKQPYYFEKNKLWLSNDRDAFILTLHQGNISDWALGQL